MNVRLIAAAALAIAVSALPLRAQTPYLVADLNTTSSDGQRSSNPGNFQAFGDTLFFGAQEDAQGNELWKYSGGVASRVADIRPGTIGAFPSALMDIGGGIYLFRAHDGPHGYELWRTDGTAAGTSLVKDIHPSTNGLAAWRREVLNGRLFFMANEGVNGAEPWVSDGTAAGTQMLFNLDNSSTSSNPTMFVPLGGKMLIFGANGLWSSDGTTIGTTLLATVGVAWGQGRIGNTLYFTATGSTGATGRELWKTDGTAAGTQPVADVVPGPTSGLLSNSLLVPIGSTLYFTAYHPGGGGIDLWKSDGTAAGTQFIQTMTSPNPNPEAWSMFAIGSLLLIESGDDIWRSDGTTAGTYVVDSGHWSRNLVPAFGRGYYFRDGASKDELWSTDGATTQFVSVADSGLQLTSTGGKLYFSAAENLFGQEPWVSESGTTATTHRLANINPDLPPSSVPDTLTVVNDIVFFRAWDGFVQQREIWRSNGTSAGTFRVTSLLGSGGSLSLLTGWSGALYFQKDAQLWRSDGTVAGTAMMKDMTPSPVHSMFPGSRYLFLGLNQYAQPTLGRTDGTAAGTITLGDLLPHDQRTGLPAGYTELAGRVFVTGREYSQTEGAWVSDGTPETTKRVVGDEPRVEGFNPAAAAGAFFFVASTTATGRELWRSDGIGGSEMLVKDIAPGDAESVPMDLTAAGRYLYFVANDSVHGVELWRTDGTAAGTILLGDIFAGGQSSQPVNLTAAGELLYFTANDGSHGTELWRTDGTAAGTVMVSDLFPGTAPSDPGPLKFAEGTLWFAADNGVAGRELWRVTGTGVPSMVADLAPGAESSYPTELVQAGQLLYFAAHTSTVGRELWAMPLTTSSLRVDDARIVEGTGGTRTLRFTVTRTGSTSGAAGAAFTTVNGTAAGADYVAQSGTVAFTAGQTSRFIDVVVQADAVVEENEGFFVTLTSPSGATLGKSIGTGMIDDDDHRAELSIVLIPAVDSHSERRFRITNAGPSAANDVRVRYSESPGHLRLDMNYQCSSEENPMTCNFGTLAAGASLEVFVRPMWMGGGMTDQETRPGSTVTVSVTATEPDNKPADNIVARMIGGGTRITTLPFLTSGTTTTAEVSLDYDHSSEPITATLTSSVAGVVVTPSSVIIPPGQQVAQFTITIAANYTGPVKLTSTPVTYEGSFMTIQVVAPGQMPKLASAMAFDHQSAIFGTPVLLPVTVAARKHDGTKPTGLVSLLNQQGDVVLAQQQLDPAGKTVFEIEDLQPGNRLFLLRYHGDANFVPLQYGSVAVSVRGWPTNILVDSPPMMCAGATSEIHIDVQTTATTNPPTGSVEVTMGGTVIATLPLSPTGTPGLSRAILRHAFTAGEAGYNVQYIPTGTFDGSLGYGRSSIYPCVSMNVRATGISSSSIAVNWTPVAGATQYEVFRVDNWWTSVGTTTSAALVDSDTSMKSYLYTVRAMNAAGQTIGWGAPDIALPMVFVDDPFVPNVTTIRGVHHQQVRVGIIGMRYIRSNIGDIDDATPPTPPGTIVSAAGIMALREEITALRRGLGLPQFIFTDPTLTAGSPMKAIHMQELRDAVK